MNAFKAEKTFGPYQLHAKIAEGGMAEVILGTSQQKEFQGQFLAIKRLRPHLNSNKPFVNLLIHEAKIGVLLNHPGIATVYDLGSYKSEFFLTMEYVHGKSLDKILERVEKSKSPRLSVEVATYIILEALRALAFAHQLKDIKGRDLNIIHRDISPGNILLSYRGEVKLSDFGIATAENRLQPNFSNIPLGKLAYMAPEQVVNDPVVRASDIYSLGVVYYQLLSGQLPFHADNANNLYKKVVDGRVTDLRLTGPTISAGIRDIVTKCLNRSAAKRYQSAPELYQALVDHFNAEYELDFNSKVIRQYYKKKLSEYMRSAFESEIIQEIEITQECLKKGASQESFKVTAPQDLKRLADFEKEGDAPEATVFEEDLTNEATRHFPLTDDERKSILKGLPPKEVISETRKQIERAGKNTTGFDLRTVPEYDLAVEDSAVQRLSVNDKLKLSSLDKDQKETLTQHAPDLEIASDQDLHAFEQNTFSGKRPVKDVNETREMSRSDIMKDFEAIDRARNSSATSKVQGLDEETVKASKSSILKQLKDRDSKKPSARNLTPAPKNDISDRTSILNINQTSRDRMKKICVAVLVLILLAVGASTLYRFFENVRLSTRLGLTNPQNIGLIYMGEVSNDTQKKLIQSMQEGADSLPGVEQFFENEFKKYNGSSINIVHFTPAEFQTNPRPLTAQQNISELLRSDKIFYFLEKIGTKPNLQTNATIYIYFYPYDPGSSQNVSFPERFLGERSNHRGVVFAPAHASKRLYNLQNIAREVAFLYGATDKEDPSTGLAIAPYGLANPKEIPLYPQSKAELMGRDVAINALQERPISSLKDIVVGPQTAYELGWIDNETLTQILK